ncbi:MAG: uroporphyrinogen decarboxylase family protein [Planctomycetota bacterium]|jgi:uroporphyrinogen-III decarboxylase
MTSRERVIRALRFEAPDRVPRHLWRLPGTKMFITVLDFNYGKGKRTSGTRYKKDEIAADEWGCRWHAAEDGIAGEVKDPPIKDISKVEHLSAPYEILEAAEFAEVNGMCARTDAFTLAWTTVRPFERMQFLLGTERLFIGLMDASGHLYRLRDIIHGFFMEEIRRWVETDVDGISFMDDWGSQRSPLISPNLWRDFFKPLYKDYCDLIHSKGKYAFMHSDGYIEPLYTDLMEAGVDAVNSQLFCMDIEDLGRKYRGRITFWGEIDRQHILPFGTKQQVADAVRRVRNALWMPEGGIIAQCEFGLKDPAENIETVFETWESIS